MFCPGCQEMAWDVLSRDVLSYILEFQYFLGYEDFVDIFGGSSLLNAYKWAFVLVGFCPSGLLS